ncbi:hypothetical protein [Pseudomonas sp. B329]|uniref:hypothetical protein n=1 Tax=Pseudomonas sp. B329 TaxID=1553459 RepID=UPI002003B84C|nr:hypothetical protein [Pseudomonas sp. B329]
MTIHQIINMITVGHRFMAAIRPVLMVRRMSAAIVLRRALSRVSLVNGQHMLVNVITMNMMQMSVMNVVHMSIMFYRGVSTTSLVFVIMVRVFITARHSDSPAKMQRRLSR